MSLVGKQAPNFTAEAVMADGTFKEVKLSDYQGKYVALYFYPLDFTFVCPSEILAYNKKVVEFKEKGCELIGVSIDSKFSHHAWRETPVEKGGIGKIDYPLVSDMTKNISRDYGVLIEDAGVALRGLFLIDQNGTVQHETINHLSLGRNVDETMRMLDALQYTEKYGEVCPANWKEGDEAMKPDANGVADWLSKHAK